MFFDEQDEKVMKGIKMLLGDVMRQNAKSRDLPIVHTSSFVSRLFFGTLFLFFLWIFLIFSMFFFFFWQKTSQYNQL